MQQPTAVPTFDEPPVSFGKRRYRWRSRPEKSERRRVQKWRRKFGCGGRIARFSYRGSL